MVFGPEDQFTNRFAALARMSPMLPLIGGGATKLQPVYVGDVATAVADAVDGKTRAGATYELGGPEVLTMREIMEIILATIERERMLVSLPFGLAKLQALLLQFAPGALKLTPDQVELLRVRQCGVGGGQGRGADAGGARHRARFAGSDRAAISLALPRAGQFQKQERVSYRSSRRTPERHRRADSSLRDGVQRPFMQQRKTLWLMRIPAFVGTTRILPSHRQRDQAERADDDAPPGEQHEAVAGDVAQERLHHDRSR